MPTKKTTSKKDIRLLNQTAKGKDSAFEKLYDRYSVPIYNYLVRLTHEEAIAENLLQETFLAVWKGAKDFRGEAQVKNWIYRIAHNNAVSWLRKSLKDEMPREVPLKENQNQETPLEDPEKLIIKASQRDNVHLALERLSAKHRAVVELAYGQNFTYKEIARIVDCPEGTVKSRMNYALKRLDGILKGMGE